MQVVDFQGARHVVWLVSSEYTENSICPAIEPSPRNSSGHKSTRVATLRQPSRIPADLGPSSPYPDAIMVIGFQTADETGFQVLTYPMQKRVVDYAVRLEWIKGLRSRPDVTPWDTACRERPRLSQVRQLNDHLDVAVGLYWINGWQLLD